jgi:biopolymer transport protein ExbD
MARVKMARKSTMVDMTAMCDMVFLILNFFIMSTSFKPDEPVAIVTPSSINTKLLPDADVILVSLDKNGRVFFDMDGQPKRQKLIEDINTQFKLELTELEINNYILGASVGTDMQHLKEYLSLKSADRKKSPVEKGIPTDSANNELAIWIEYAQAAQVSSIKSLKYCIKADNETPYPLVKRVLETFKKKNIQHINLVTSLEAAPEGTAAAELAR